MLGKSTSKVSIAVMASRVLGLIRDQIFAGMFGHGVLMDCFNIAFRIPNLLRDLFAEGALSQAFVTVFSKKVKTDGPESAWPLAAKMLSLVSVAMALISIIGIIFSPQLVHLLTAFNGAGGKVATFQPSDIELTITLTRIMWPFMLLVSTAALVMGILNARGVFGIPALSSCFFNIGSIVVGAGLGLWLDPHCGPKTMIGFSIGVLAGGLGQLVCQLPALHRLGFRWKFNSNWRDSQVANIFGLMLPAVISASVVQINVVINSQFATYVGSGAVSSLSWAFRLMNLPIGVFGVAVATVTLPALSRAATESVQGKEFGDVLSRGLRLVTFLVLPSAIGLCFLAEPIISVIYEHGKFDAAGRIETAAALRGYGYGLLAYSWLKVLQPAFYAANRRWVPLMVSIFAICLSIASNYLFVVKWQRGVEALSTTTSIVAVANFIILYLAMCRITPHLQTKQFLTMLFRTFFAAAGMIGCILIANHYLFQHLTHMNKLLCLLYLTGTIALSGAVYFIISTLVRVPEAKSAVDLVMKKLGKNKAA